MTTQQVIEKHFKDSHSIWFDFIDYIKSNYDQQRKGLTYCKKNGRYEIYAENEDAETILLDVLDETHGHKLQMLILAFQA